MTDDKYVTVYICIGNSDDKLSQAAWGLYCADIDRAVFHVPDVRIHGTFYSLSSSLFQNACWCVELPLDAAVLLMRQLGELAHTYGQTSISWAEACTTFIQPLAPDVARQPLASSGWLNTKARAEPAMDVRGAA